MASSKGLISGTASQEAPPCTQVPETKLSANGSKRWRRPFWPSTLWTLCWTRAAGQNPEKCSFWDPTGILIFWDKRLPGPPEVGCICVPGSHGQPQIVEPTPMLASHHGIQPETPPGRASMGCVYTSVLVLAGAGSVMAPKLMWRVPFLTRRLQQVKPSSVLVSGVCGMANGAIGF